MKRDRVFKIFAALAIIFLCSLLPIMVLAYDGNSIALTYCNGLEAFSGAVLGGMRSVMAGLEGALT